MKCMISIHPQPWFLLYLIYKWSLPDVTLKSLPRGTSVSRPDLYQLACHRESNPDFPQITLRENAQVDPLAVT